MLDANYNSASDFARRQALIRRLLTAVLVLTIALVFGSMGALAYLKPEMSGGLVFAAGLALFTAIALPILVWNYPVAGFYILFAGAMLFEVAPNTGIITEKVPFFTNINVYARSNLIPGLDALKFSVAEVLMIMTLVCWIVRTVARRQHRFVGGAYLGWMLAYLAMVVAGFIHGMASGGDLLKALWEVRPQFYFVLAYVMAANIVERRNQAVAVVWVGVLCTGFKGILGAIKYFQMGMEVSVDGVLTHEESLFLNLLLLVLIVSGLAGTSRRLTWAAAILAPCAVLAALANQRRAGIAALIIALIPLLPILWCVLRERRQQIARFAVVFGVVTLVYMPIAWNGKGAWALPARSIRSQSDPNERDSGSNYYRLVEDLDLKFTRDMQPWVGIGYGKPFIMLYPLPAVTTDMLQFYAHNSILWVWMRIGHIGFFTLLMLFATVLIRGCQTLKETRDRGLVLVGMLAVLDLLMVFTYAKYDLQLVNYRTMWVLGVFIGFLGALPRLDGEHSGERAAAPTEAEEGPEEPAGVGLPGPGTLGRLPGAGGLP